MSNKKLRLIALSFVLVMMCSVIQGSENPVILRDIVSVDQNTTAAEVDSYNFDDGDISNWTIFAIDDGVPYNNYPGNYSAEDGTLRSGGDHFNIALLNCSVAYGTWNFSVFVVDQPIDHEIVIPFILVEYNMDLYLMRAYFFQIITGMYRNNPESRLMVGKMYLDSSDDGRAPVWFDEFPSDDIWGWKNFIITRDNTNQFYIYMNESLVLSFKDGQHTTCNQFGFSTRAGPALDNLVISDSMDFDAAPPEWVQEPIDQTIGFGQDFRYNLNATDFSGLGAWTLNDTTNFAIDSNGIITNIVDLDVAKYDLNVSVSDSLGFTRSAEFSLVVRTIPQPDLTLYVIVGGVGIVIVALVIIFMKKRG